MAERKLNPEGFGKAESSSELNIGVNV